MGLMDMNRCERLIGYLMRWNASISPQRLELGRKEYISYLTAKL